MSTPPPSRSVSFLVDESHVGRRLDAVVSEVAGISRSQATLRIDAGDVLVNGHLPSKAGVLLRVGDQVAITVPPPPPSEATPEDLPLAVVFEDEHLIVINKAADMVVHPSAGHDSGTLVNALVHRYGVLAPDLGTEDGRPRPGIVHRLDLGTSGLLVVARTEAARDALSAALAEHAVRRRYLAVVHGLSLPDTGTWQTMHDRHPKDRRRYTSKTTTGRTAVTHFEVLRRGRALSLIACRLETGRTHQIRVHCSDHHAPIVGDELYGGTTRPVPGPEAALVKPLTRQALHAFELEFTHPATGEPMRFVGAPPTDFSTLIARAFGVIDAVTELRSVTDGEPQE